MQQFFSKVLKQKKILFFVFLFLAVVIFAIPQITLASWYNPLSWGTDFAKGAFNAFVAVALMIPLFLSAFLADFGGILLKWSLSLATQGVSYTNSPAVQIGWPIVRDLSNMIIVLGFVVIGIATSLRIETYKATKLLAPLIISALLVNFSLLLCGILIDGTNILMNFFFSSIGDPTVFAANTAKTIGVLGQTFTSDWTVFGIELLSMMVFNFIAFFIYILYIFLLLGRIIALWMLVILSPLAFVCYVFPVTKNVWNEWWKNFWQWCIIGVPAGLFYYIAARMINSMATTLQPSISTDNVFTDASVIKLLTGSVSLLLPALFLVVGFLVSLKFSAMGASAILGFANKYKGAAMKGTLGALSKTTGNIGKMAGWAGNKVGNNNPIGKGLNLAAKGLNKYQGGINTLQASSQKTRSAFGRGLEGIGAKEVGGQAGVDQAKVEAAAKLSTAAYTSGNPADKARIENLAKTGMGIEKAGAIQAIVGEKKLHKVFTDKNGNVDLNAINKGITEAEGYGASRNIRKNAENSMPELAKYNGDMIKEIMTKTNPATGRNFTQVEAPREAVRKIHAGMNAPDMKNLPDSQMTVHFVQDSNAQTLARAGLDFNTDQKDALRKVIPQLQEQIRSELRVSKGASEKDMDYANFAASREIQDNVRKLSDKINTIKNLL
jgi:hypothetical protein